MTYQEWFIQVIKNKKEHKQRWGQAIMNASPTEWRDSNLLPDIWEIDERNHWKILLWDEYAAQILNQGALNGN